MNTEDNPQGNPHDGGSRNRHIEKRGWPVCPHVNYTCARAIMHVLEYYFDDDDHIPPPSITTENTVLSFMRNMRREIGRAHARFDAKSARIAASDAARKHVAAEDAAAKELADLITEQREDMRETGHGQLDVRDSAYNG